MGHVLKGMEIIAVQCYAILINPRIVIVTIIMINALLFLFQEMQQSDLEHFADVDM